MLRTLDSDVTSVLNFRKGHFPHSYQCSFWIWILVNLKTSLRAYIVNFLQYIRFLSFRFVNLVMLLCMSSFTLFDL